MKKILTIGYFLLATLTIQADLIWNKDTTLGELADYVNGNVQLEEDDTLLLYITEVMNSGVTDEQLYFIMADIHYSTDIERVGEDAIFKLIENRDAQINISNKAKLILENIIKG